MFRSIKDLHRCLKETGRMHKLDWNMQGIVVWLVHKQFGSRLIFQFLRGKCFTISVWSFLIWAINFVYSSKFISWLIKHELKMDECGVQDSKWLESLELIQLSINRAAGCCLAQTGPRRDFWNSGHCIGSRISPTWINLLVLIYSLPDNAVMSHFHWHMMGYWTSQV